MSRTVSGVIEEVGAGFLVFRSGMRVRFTSQAFRGELAPGDRVIIRARLRGAEWMADDIQLAKSTT